MENRVNPTIAVEVNLLENSSTDHTDDELNTGSSISVDVDRGEGIVEKSQALNDSSFETYQPLLPLAHNEIADTSNTGNEMDNATNRTESINTSQVDNAFGNDTWLNDTQMADSLEEAALGSTVEGDEDYQPTTEEIEAARMWEQINDQEAQPRRLTDEESADAELALLIQTQISGGYDSENDHDTAPEDFECVCGDTFTWQQALDMITLNCGHVRCNECLNLNVAFGLTSMRDYPPRCCNLEIEIELVQDHLSDQNLFRWVAVKDEFEDRAPIYCAVKTCSVYLTKHALDTDHKWALCPSCTVKTCSGCLCLEVDHVEPDKCPERIDQMDKELMTKKKWKPCPGCKHMIERIEGCDHMICDCGEEFCYGCGRRYVGGMPCNCHGQRNWVEEQPEANDLVVQQQIFNNFNRPPNALEEPEMVNEQENWGIVAPPWGFEGVDVQMDQADGEELEDEVQETRDG